MKLASKPCAISSACGAPLRPAVASIASAHINRGADPETGIKMVALRSDLAPEQRAEALRIGRIGFTSAGAKRKPTEAIAAYGRPRMASSRRGQPYRPVRNDAWLLAARDRATSQPSSAMRPASVRNVQFWLFILAVLIAAYLLGFVTYPLV